MEINNGLKKHMTKTYGWMVLGVALTFAIAYTLSSTGLIFNLLLTIPYFSIVVMIAQIGVVIALTARLSKISAATAKLLFFAYSSIMGVSLSVITLLYDVQAVIIAFMAAVLFFGLLAFFGTVTKADLSKVGSICGIGLMSMIVFSLVGMLFNFNVNSILYSVVGLLIFTGLTAWDAQKCKRLYIQNQHSIEMVEKLSIYSALELYLDFINIFLYLLRILGSSRD